MPRSCSSSDMAGTFMLYPPGTDGAAVTEVRLYGGRSSQYPELRNTRCALTQWIPGPGLLEPHETPDPVCSNAVDSRFHCVQGPASGSWRLASGVLRPGPGAWRP